MRLNNSILVYLFVFNPQGEGKCDIGDTLLLCDDDYNVHSPTYQYSRVPSYSSRPTKPSHAPTTPEPSKELKFSLTAEPTNEPTIISPATTESPSVVPLHQSTRQPPPQRTKRPTVLSMTLAPSVESTASTSASSSVEHSAITTTSPTYDPTMFSLTTDTQYYTSLRRPSKRKRPTKLPTISLLSLKPSIITVTPWYTYEPTISLIPTVSPGVEPSCRHPNMERPTISPPPLDQSIEPSATLTELPTHESTVIPATTDSPSIGPTRRPTRLPLPQKTKRPTILPTLSTPSDEPTISPTIEPTHELSVIPATSDIPSIKPSSIPTQLPKPVKTKRPTLLPFTLFPSINVTATPTSTDSPSIKPSCSHANMERPTTPPISVVQSLLSSSQPSYELSPSPNMLPRVYPSMDPSYEPSITSTYIPTSIPSHMPTISHTNIVTMFPTTLSTPFTNGNTSIPPNELPSASFSVALRLQNVDINTMDDVTYNKTIDSLISAMAISCHIPPSYVTISNITTTYTASSSNNSTIRHYHRLLQVIEILTTFIDYIITYPFIGNASTTYIIITTQLVQSISTGTFEYIIQTIAITNQLPVLSNAKVLPDGSSISDFTIGHPLFPPVTYHPTTATGSIFTIVSHFNTKSSHDFLVPMCICISGGFILLVLLTVILIYLRKRNMKKHGNTDTPLGTFSEDTLPMSQDIYDNSSNKGITPLETSRLTIADLYNEEYSSSAKSNTTRDKSHSVSDRNIYAYDPDTCDMSLFHPLSMDDTCHLYMYTFDVGVKSAAAMSPSLYSQSCDIVADNLVHCDPPCPPTDSPDSILDSNDDCDDMKDNEGDNEYENNLVHIFDLNAYNATATATNSPPPPPSSRHISYTDLYILGSDQTSTLHLSTTSTSLSLLDVDIDLHMH